MRMTSFFGWSQDLSALQSLELAQTSARRVENDAIVHVHLCWCIMSLEPQIAAPNALTRWDIYIYYNIPNYIYLYIYIYSIYSI